MSLDEAIAIMLVWPGPFSAPGHEAVRRDAYTIVAKHAGAAMLRELKAAHEASFPATEGKPCG